MSQTKQQELMAALQRSAKVIQKYKKALSAYHEPLAIVGMGCRYPSGVETPEQFWDALLNGFDGIIDLPAQRAQDMPTFSDRADESARKQGGYLEDVDQFDPTFFGLSPREVISMDPAHRLLLETSWEAFEAANILPSDLFNTETGVFIGIGASDYMKQSIVQSRAFYTVTGNLASTAAGRVSYSMGLTGPCVSIETACSSSLASIHLACQSLRNGECDAALAGGVNLILDDDITTMMGNGNALSADARCKTFDADANGYVRGEGCGVILLKRLSDAEVAGDNIIALIRGTAINQDGPSGGLTVPNGPSQERVIQRALADGRLNPDQISYIEAHGTGTPLGDPIEIGALGGVFKKREQPLYVGSLKTNVGHLEWAAGVAGLMKLALSVKNGKIPQNLHLNTPNPLIDFETARVEVPLETLDWSPGQERMGGVSSFGFSGTNAHIIVGEAPATVVDEDESQSVQPAEHTQQLVTISAKSEQALRSYVQKYHDFVAKNPDINLGDLAHTSQVGRTHFNWRAGFSAENIPSLQAQLAAFDNTPREPIQQGKPKVAFLFTGQGSQFVQMGRDLYETSAVVRDVIDRSEAVALEVLGRSLIELLYPETAPAHNDLMESHPCGQIANFVIECALADLWKSWGVQPDFVLGHSLGDFAAAYTAGVLSLEDGVRLVGERGRLMETAVGKMVSVLASEADVLPFIEGIEGLDDVTVGVINGPRAVVVSGGHNNVTAVAEQLKAAGFKTRLLDIPMAAHSPLLDPVLDTFEAAVRNVSLALPQTNMVSSMTGGVISAEITNPTYWRNHLRNTVRFADGVTALQAQGVDICIEIGPKPTLLGLVARITDELTLLPSLRSPQNDWQQLLESLGGLYTQGVALDWEKITPSRQYRKITLPTYPFQRQRYWVAPLPKQREAILRPLVDKMSHLPLHNETIFETAFSTERLPFLADHLVYGAVVSPGACQLAMVLDSAELIHNNQTGLQLQDGILPQALVIPDEGERTVQVVVSDDAFKLISFDAKATPIETATHATGKIVSAETTPSPIDLAAIQKQYTQPVDLSTFYAKITEAKIDLLASFRWVAAAWQDVTPTKTIAKLTVPEAIGSVKGQLLHPGLLDACFQVAALTKEITDDTLLPFAFDTLSVHQPAQGDQWWCHATVRDTHKWDIELLDAQGAPVLTMKGFEVRVATDEAIRGADVWRDWLYQIDWQPQPYFGQSAAQLPSPSELAGTLQEAAAALWAAHGGDSVEAKTLSAELDAQSLAYVLSTFAKVGFTFEVGSRWRSDQIAKQLGVIPSYRRLLDSLLLMLADVGILAQEGDGWRVLRVAERDEIMVVSAETSLSSNPEQLLLARCGAKLSEVMRGLQDPVALLFPDGDMAVTNQIYSESTVAQVMNGIVQQIIAAVVEQLPVDLGIRIVELGAGTCGTTSELLPQLPADRSDYLFTDIGATFINQAQMRYAEAYPFMRYQVLDIEQPPSKQQADVVIAANVLHATRNLPETLANVRRLLQSGGQLVLVEATQRQRWVDLTFGLTDGWWRFADARKNHPLLSGAQWQTLLAANGFTDIEIIEQGGQAVIHAKADVSVPAAIDNPPWLILSDESGVGEAIATQLTAQGERALVVQAGTTYQQIDDSHFTIAPAQADTYQQLLQAVGAVQGIVHLWSLDAASLDKSSDLIATTRHGYESALLLTQALLQAQIEPAAGLWLVTRDSQAANGSEAIKGVVQSGLWGIGTIIQLEHPELNAVCVDLEAGMAVTDQAAHLCAQLIGGATNETKIALRTDAYYAARLATYAPEQTTKQTSMVTVKPDATYAITGGVNGLGLAVAERLAAHGARHLLLISRSKSQAAVQPQLDALTDLGITVTCAQADVTDWATLKQTLQQVDSRYPLRGIIHSVGVLDDGALTQQNWARFCKVLAPKMQGAWHLHQLTQAEPLDFFVLFSSVASMLGNRGQANHAAANAFLDRFVQYRRQQGLAAQSINWGAWAEIGSAKDLVSGHKTQLEAIGFGAIAPEKGLDAFSYLLAQAPAQVGVLPLNWTNYLANEAVAQLAYYEAFKAPAAQVAEAVAQISIRQAIAAATEGERLALIVDFVRDSTAKVLGMTALPNVRDGFSDMGMDSLMSIELGRRLNRELEMGLPSTLAFEYPTIEKLAGYILEEIAEAIEDENADNSESVSDTETSIDEMDTLLELDDESAELSDADDALAASLLELESLLD